MVPAGIDVVHAHPGRVRLKFPQIKHDPEFAARIEKALAPVPAVKRVESNPVTGNLLVLYDPGGIASPETLEALEPLSESLAEHLPELDVEEFARWLAAVDDKRPRKRTHNNPGPRRAGALPRPSLKVLLPATFAGFGVHALVTAPAPVPWYHFMSWALTAFLGMNHGKSPGPESAGE
jgi:hypothetical protein